MTSLVRATIVYLAHVSPWFWIAAMFGGQAAGAVAVTLWLRLPIEETLVPVVLLVSGMVVTGWFARRKSHRTAAGWRRFVPFLLYALFIYSLSSRSFRDAQVGINPDLFHLVEFSTLGLFLACLWYPLLRSAGANLFSAAVLSSGLLYALSDEFHQSFVPGRTPSVIDLLYDSSALVFSCVVFLVGVNLRLQLQKAWPSGELCPKEQP